jgi:hypothetical protein
MCLYDGPSDVTKHIAETRERFESFGYDHRVRSSTSLGREIEESRYRELCRNGFESDSRMRPFKTIITRLLTLMKNPSQVK